MKFTYCLLVLFLIVFSVYADEQSQEKIITKNESFVEDSKDDYEDDNTFDSATEIKCNESQEHSLHNTNDEDWFIVWTDLYCSINIENLKEDFSYLIEIYDSEKHKIGSEYIDRQNNFSMERFLKNDKFYIRFKIIDDYSHYWISFTNYQITFNLSDSLDFSNTLLYNETQKHSFHSCEEDWFTIKGNGKLTFIDSNLLPFHSINPLNPSIELYDTNGNIYIPEVEYKSTNIHGQNLFAIKQFFPSGDLFFIKLSLCCVFCTDYYEITAYSVEEDIYESDNRSFFSTTLLLDQESQLHSLHDYDDEDWFIIREWDIYSSIKIVNLNKNYDYLIELYKDDVFPYIGEKFYSTRFSDQEINLDSEELGLVSDPFLIRFKFVDHYSQCYTDYKININRFDNDVKIDSIVPSEVVLTRNVNFQVEGSGFDENTRVLLIPEKINSLLGKFEINDQISYFFDDYQISDFFVDNNNIAYVILTTSRHGSERSELKIIDISVLENPNILSSFGIDKGSYIYGYLDDKTLWVLDDFCTMEYLIDISDLLNPEIIEEGLIDEVPAVYPPYDWNIDDDKIQIIDNKMYIAGDKTIFVFFEPDPIYLRLTNYTENKISLDIGSELIEGKYCLIAYNSKKVSCETNSTNQHIEYNFIEHFQRNEHTFFHNNLEYLHARFAVPYSNISQEPFVPKNSSLYLDYATLEYKNPFNVSGFSDKSILGNSEAITISVDIEELHADISYNDYTSVFSSSNQFLLPDENIHWINQEKKVVITPSKNRFGNTYIFWDIIDSNGTKYRLDDMILTVDFQKIEIENITPLNGILGKKLELTATGKGFDKNTMAFLVPDCHNLSETYSFLHNAQDIDVVGNIAYVADGRDGFKIIDATYPYHPIIITSIDASISGFASGISVQGDIVYVANNDSSIKIFDCSIPQNPKFIKSIKLNGTVKVIDNLILSNTNDGILTLYDLGNPAIPIGDIQIPYGINSIAVTGNIAYVSNDSYVHIIDISDLSSPKITGTTNNLNFFDMDFFGTTAYATDASGIKIIDISIPSNPVILATIDIDHSVKGICAADNRIYVVGGWQYFSILPNEIVEIMTITDSTLELIIPPLMSVCNYSLRILNPQYSVSKDITLTPPFRINPISDTVISSKTQNAYVPLIITPILQEAEGSKYTAIGYSENPAVFPNENISIQEEGLNRTIQLIPPHHQFGTILVNICVSDGHVFIKENFYLTIKYIQLDYHYSRTIESASISEVTSVEKDGYLYEVNTTANCIIKKFNNQVIATWGKKGTENGSFDRPTGIAMDKDGFIYVADSGNNRVQVFTFYGEYITSFGNYGQGQLLSPEFIFFQEDEIVISETEKQECKIFYQVDYTEGNTKAIIVAGSKASDSLKKAIDNCANLAYNALIYQGVGDNNICYLSSDKSDIKFDDYATVNNIETAITQWALGQETAISEKSITADSLVIYFVGHGNNETFIIKDNEELSATDLRQWLDQIQNMIPGKLIFIYEACHSGSFTSVLSNANLNRERIIITSAKGEEEAILAHKGVTSFSNYFWSDIFNGMDLKTAFEHTQRITELPFNVIKNTPQINANNNGTNNEIYDLNLVQNVFIGNGVQNTLNPVIKDVSPRQIIAETESAELTATVAHSHGIISEVWASISCENNVTPTVISLEYNPSDNIYEGSFTPDNNDYAQNKRPYIVSIYAKDINGLVSASKLTVIHTNNTKRRYAILVMGKDTQISLKEKAIRSLTFKLYYKEDIYVVDGRLETPDEALKSAIKKCMSDNTQDVLLFMVGNGDENYFYFNETQKIKNEDLRDLIDDYQDEEILVTIIYNGPFGNKYLSPLKNNNTRILLSCIQSENSNFLMDENFSFSWQLWNMLPKEANLSDIFLGIKNVMKTVVNNSNNNLLPQIIHGTKLSLSYIIGYDFMVLSDIPRIESVSPKQTLFCKHSAKIFAHNVSIQSNQNRIDKVVAFITPPASIQQLSHEPEIVHLKNIQGTDDYVAPYDNFSFAGEYYIAICAFDIMGNMSDPLTTTVIQKIGVNTVISVLDMLTGIDHHNPIFSEFDIHGDSKIGLEEAVYLMQCREQYLPVNLPVNP